MFLSYIDVSLSLSLFRFLSPRFSLKAMKFKKKEQMFRELPGVPVHRERPYRRTQKESGHQQAKKRSLKRNQTC